MTWELIVKHKLKSFFTSDIVAPACGATSDVCADLVWSAALGQANKIRGDKNLSIIPLKIQTKHTSYCTDIGLDTLSEIISIFSK